tara:strand:- start:2655 stop:2888 length:234 start_codon:yes stop_codon:yes gene_type:complete
MPEGRIENIRRYHEDKGKLFQSDDEFRGFVAARLGTITETIANFDNRISVLERWVYVLTGGIMLVAFAVPVAVALVR